MKLVYTDADEVHMCQLFRYFSLDELIEREKSKKSSYSNVLPLLFLIDVVIILVLWQWVSSAWMLILLICGLMVIPYAILGLLITSYDEALSLLLKDKHDGLQELEAEITGQGRGRPDNLQRSPPLRFYHYYYWSQFGEEKYPLYHDSVFENKTKIGQRVKIRYYKHGKIMYSWELVLR